jgi:hypothetical protein
MKCNPVLIKNSVTISEKIMYSVNYLVTPDYN